MDPTILGLGVIGPGFLNQVPTLTFIIKNFLESLGSLMPPGVFSV